ncbi:MAG: DinB family protein [Flavobacteriales bacterium]|nr:DinB family protein [Flavobacteriales bacterium]
MDANAMIDALLEVLRGQIARAREIQRLPAELLLKRPAQGKWNALEVFEHMNLSSGVYARGIAKVFGGQAARHPANPVFKAGFLGDFSTKAMLPKPDGRIAWRMKTLRMFDPPRQHGASSESIARFIALCECFLRLLEQARGTDLNRMKVVSSLGPILCFKAGDAFRFPIAHQQRHFLQIERLLAQ